jgi:hypothetical protein
MSLTVAELNEQFLDVTKRLSDAIHRLDVEVAVVNSNLRFIKWIGVFLATVAVGVITFSYQAVRKATQIEDVVVAVQRDLAEAKETSKARDDQFAKALESLSRIEKTLAASQPAPSRKD